MASTVVPKLPDEGDHALLLRGQGAATATNSLLLQVFSSIKIDRHSNALIARKWPFDYKTIEENSATQVASRLDYRGEEGAADVVRAVAELLHLTGGQLVGFPSTSFCSQFCHSGLCPDGGTW